MRAFTYETGYFVVRVYMLVGKLERNSDQLWYVFLYNILMFIAI